MPGPKIPREITIYTDGTWDTEMENQPRYVSVEQIEAAYRQGLTDGAELVCGGGNMVHAMDADNCWYEYATEIGR